MQVWPWACYSARVAQFRHSVKQLCSKIEIIILNLNIGFFQQKGPLQAIFFRIVLALRLLAEQRCVCQLPKNSKIFCALSSYFCTILEDATDEVTLGQVRLSVLFSNCLAQIFIQIVKWYLHNFSCKNVLLFFCSVEVTCIQGQSFLRQRNCKRCQKGSLQAASSFKKYIFCRILM